MQSGGTRPARNGAKRERRPTPEHHLLSGGRFRLDGDLAPLRRRDLPQQPQIPYAQYGTTGPHGRHDDQRLRLSRIDPDTNQHDDGHERRAHGHHVVLLLI